MRGEFLWVLQFLAVKLRNLAVNFCKFTAYSSGEITYYHRLEKRVKKM